MKTSFVTFFALATAGLSLTGCGGESPGPGSTANLADDVDSCTLLTAAEISSTTGVTPGEQERPNPGLNNCQWPGPGSPLPLVYIGLSYKTADSWEEYRKNMIEIDFGDPEENGERIDIGVFGHYQPDVSMIQVQTTQGPLITLRVRGGDKVQIVELANKAAARLR